MKLLQRGTILLFILVLGAFVGVRFYVDRTVDRTPPVITCDSDVIEVSVRATKPRLLKGVTAADDRDGDLTDQVMVKGITNLIGDDTAKVTYIVFDSSNNMSTVSRTVRYSDYQRPRFSLKEPLVYPVGGKVSLLDKLSASDVIDGDISGNIRVTAQNVNANAAGVYSVTVQVFNSLGDVETLPLKVVVGIMPYSNQEVALSDYVVYVEQGESFDPARYILTTVAPGELEIVDPVDTTRPGVYEVSYTVKNYTAYQTVVVR